MDLKYFVVHCTATPEGREVQAGEIRRWHTAPVSQGGRGWRQVGYSELVQLDGRLVNLAAYNFDDTVDAWEITNGVRGVNGASRHIVYSGGMDKANKKPKDTRTAEQKETLRLYLALQVRRYPDIQIAGHNQFDKGKACPSFDMVKQLLEWGFPEKNIYGLDAWIADGNKKPSKTAKK